MNNRFLFKGKTEHGLWVVGFLKFWNDRFYIIPQDSFREHMVIESSICQCTGCKDADGKDIFEGDVLKYKYPTMDKMFTVEWFASGFVVKCFEQPTIKWTLDKSDIYLVIGNIFDGWHGHSSVTKVTSVTDEVKGK